MQDTQQQTQPKNDVATSIYGVSPRIDGLYPTRAGWATAADQQPVWLIWPGKTGYWPLFQMDIAVDNSYLSVTLGGEDRNVEQIGVFVAWLVANDLLDTVFAANAGSAVTRVRMQDLNGAEFLTTVMHGELKPEQLSQQARAFTEHYVMSGQFAADVAAVPFDGEDEWHRYDLLAPTITAAWRAFSEPKSLLKSVGAKILAFPSRKP